MADETPSSSKSETPSDIKEQVVFWFFMAFVVFIAKGTIDWWNELSPGTHCSLTTAAYGLKDLNQTYLDFEKAETAGDQIGLADLAYREAAVLLPAGTQCLVIDMDSKSLIRYRQVRILDGPFAGKVFWLNKTDFDLPQPSSAVTRSGDTVGGAAGCSTRLLRLQGPDSSPWE